MPNGPTIVPLIECEDLALCGGKAINLGHMLRCGLPVPDGFVISTAAFRQCQQDGGELPDSLAEEISAAYRQLGSPSVAVRSSATAEDLAEASMAGQYETLLDVSGEESLIDAVKRCWQSIGSKRLQSYLKEHGIDASRVAMAVVVQRLVPADTAGVLFTANPRTAARDEMLIEAAWGLGEAVVSGVVQPDVVVLERDTGQEKSYAIADKAVWIQPGSDRQQQAVDQQRRSIRCLSPENVRDLWALGRRVVEHFAAEQDIEWAICNDEPFLLQSRAITTLDDADAYRQCLDNTRQWLRQRKAEGRGDWVRHNIAETLPHPTPLTWTIIRRFMSGSGGFGTLYRSVGFEPSERVCRGGFLELVAGRIYSDLKLAPEMYFDGFPFHYDSDLLRCRPDAAQQPPTIPCGSWIKQAKMSKRLAAIEQSLLKLAADCDRRLNEELVPQFIAWVNDERQRDLSDLSTDEWHDLWTERERRVMDQFAPEVLLPSMIAAVGLERLRAFLYEHFWSDAPDDLLNVLAVTDKPDCTVQANEALRAVGAGHGSCDQWLADYGYRGPEEFDLAAPRWREQPDEVRKMAAMLAGSADPVATGQQRLAEAEQCAAELRARLPRRFRRDFDERLFLVRRYLTWREDGKAELMLGYDLIRDLALEAGKRLAIGSDVFLFTLDEVREALASGDAARETIQDRRRRRAAERRLSLPLLIGDEEIENLGQPPKTSTGNRLTAVPLSTGSATGPVRIVHSPREAKDLGRGHVLVCPSTDPSWTPLFVNAAGLVLECGGVLSHGAVVARELGIPAVVLPEATLLLDDSETITVDGQHGVVLREGADEWPDTSPVTDPRDVRIAPDQIPPVRGPGERRAATLRSVFFLIWGVYLAAVFLLPRPWCYQPSIRLLDTVLWPLVSTLGKPGAVAAMAAALALLTLIGQRLLTDNRRLLAAKQRGNRLRKQAARLPAGSPRRTALVRATAGVQLRLLGAAFVPLAVLLGPMIVSFVWLPERVDPASWNPPPGAVAYVTATVDGEHSGPIGLEADTALTLDAQTPASQSAPPVRAVLEELLASWQEQDDNLLKPARELALMMYRRHPVAARSGGKMPPIRGSFAPQPSIEGSSDSHRHLSLREKNATFAERKATIPPAMIADLKAYLADTIPPQQLAWTIHAPAEAGRYPIALSAGDEAPVHASLVVGDLFPPEPKADLGDGRGPLQVVQGQAGSPIERVTVTYQFPRTLGDRVFFAPLRAIPTKLLPNPSWRQWDAGWLLTYIVVYLLVLLPARWLLRIP